jgi:hypothetical protein
MLYQENILLQSSTKKHSNLIRMFYFWDKFKKKVKKIEIMMVQLQFTWVEN